MTLPTEAGLPIMKTMTGGCGPSYMFYKSGWITVTYRSRRKEFAPLPGAIPDTAAAELWVQQNAPVPEHPIETEIAEYFEEPT